MFTNCDARVKNALEASLIMTDQNCQQIDADQHPLVNGCWKNNQFNVKMRMSYYLQIIYVSLSLNQKLINKQSITGEIFALNTVTKIKLNIDKY